MSTIEFCPECGSVVVGSGTDQRCTSCGLTYEEMVDLLDGDYMDEDDLQEDDEIIDGDDESGSDW